MTMPPTMTLKELEIHIDGSCCCKVSVKATTTMFDVRGMVLNRPPAGVSLVSWPNFSMAVDENVLSRKEEISTLAFDVIDQKKLFSLREFTKEKRVAPQEEPSERVAKKPRSNDNTEGKPMAVDSMQDDHQKDDTNMAVVAMNPAEANKGKDNEVQLVIAPVVDEIAKSTEKSNEDEAAVYQEEPKEDDDNKIQEVNGPDEDGADVQVRMMDKANADEAGAQQEASQHEDDVQLAEAPDGHQRSVHPKEVNADIEAQLANEAATDPEETNGKDEVQPVDAPESLHAQNNKAISRSKASLVELRRILNGPANSVFCSKPYRQELSNEIDEGLKKSPEDVIIGCLGQTGVGKSSLLNALLDDAEVLPTSGSRGCTAAVIELRYNADFLEPKGNTIVVYRGRVEFIALQEWLGELKFLLRDCCESGTLTIVARTPDREEAAASWAKINQVYGHGKMESFKGMHKDEVFDQLSKDERVVKLLGGTDGRPNTILVEEGAVDVAKANVLKESFANLTGKLRREKTKWAKDFRSRINGYVYRRGNGKEPQTWPLIRKVVLQGPWDVLKTGACLVDLPGVRDANAARAKVAQSYIQNCDKLWIFAPIKRAVDDKTAKDLMGEQFKRNLLMDGKYASVGFICTHSDDCETTEVMRDHEDVAKRVEGRWESMVGLRDKMTELGEETNELFQERRDLQAEVVDIKVEVKELQAEIKDVKKAQAADEPNNDLKDLENDLEEKNASVSTLESKMEVCTQHLQRKKEEGQHSQRQLKVLCAIVRNEYSSKCLQEDFRLGLDDLTRRPEEGDEEDPTAASQAEDIPPPIPDDFQLEVHCVASNDYLKIQGIKSTVDGPSNTFDCVEDTQIPSLRAAVHRTTAQFQESFVRNVVSTTGDLLERAKLCSIGNQEHSSSARRVNQAFQDEMKGLEQKVDQLASELKQESEEKINGSLHPALLRGARKGNSAVMSTIAAWGSKNRRSKFENGRGLHYNTYEATLMRNGLFCSSAAGQIDLNQELADPMEKEISAKWQEVIDGTIIKRYLPAKKASVDSICDALVQKLAKQFDDAGMDISYCTPLLATARQTAETHILAKFDEIDKQATKIQREVHRYLKAKTAERMIPRYEKAVQVQRGPGAFARMKDELERKAARAYERMFDGILNELSISIGHLLNVLHTGILDMALIICDSFTRVCSVCWQDQHFAMNFKTKKEIRACKDRLIPVLNAMCETHYETMAIVGLVRREVEIDVVAVDTREEQEARALKEAQEKDLYVELLDSDSDTEEEDSAEDGGEEPIELLEDLDEEEQEMIFHFGRFVPLRTVAVKSEPEESKVDYI